MLSPGKTELFNPSQISRFSFYLRDVVRPPGLIEERFQRTVQADPDEVALSGNRPDPVLLLAFWLCRAEVDVDRTVRVHLGLVEGAADARLGLAVLQQRARLGVVDGHRPEVLGRNSSRQPQAIVLSAVQIGAARVLVGRKVLRADTDHLRLHRRSDHDGAVMPEGAGVQEPGAVALELVSADEDPLPITVRVDPGLRVAVGVHDRLGHAVAQADAIRQDAVHTLVGLERGPLYDPQGMEQAQLLRREGRERLVLDHLVQPLEVADVARESGVARLERCADDARLSLTLAQRIDLEMRLVIRQRGLASTRVLLEAARHDPVAPGAGPEDEVTFRHIALVSRRQEEILPALTAIETGIAEVRQI